MLRTNCGWIFCASNPHIRGETSELFYVGKANKRSQIEMKKISKNPLIPGEYSLIEKVFVENLEATFDHVCKLLEPFKKVEHFYECEFTPIDKTFRVIESCNTLNGEKLDPQNSIRVDNIFKGGERFRCQPALLRSGAQDNKVIGYYNTDSRLIECASIGNGVISETRTVSDFDEMVDFFSEQFDENEIFHKTGEGWKRCEVWDGTNGSEWIDLWEYYPIEKYLEGIVEQIPSSAYSSLPDKWPSSWNSELLTIV